MCGMGHIAAATFVVGSSGGYVRQRFDGEVVMRTWSPPSVEAESDITLRHWRVMQTERAERHLVGMRTDTGAARVTSALCELDAFSLVAVTSSGRRYRLVSEPGWTRDTVFL
jgi:hypothetical protein